MNFIEEQMKQEGDVRFEFDGFQCRMIRQMGGGGFLCGYVMLPKENKFHGANYEDIPIDCHGGLTFSGQLRNDTENYWIGFDCAHLGDISPRWPEMFRDPHSSYKNAAYVRSEIESIVRQLKDLEAK